MGKYVIIDIYKANSKTFEYLYRNNLKKNIKEQLIESFDILNESIEVRKIPFSGKFNEKTLKKFLNDLNNDDVSGVILSESVRKEEKLYDFFKNNLILYDGYKIKEFFEEDIYKKYVTVNNKKDYEAELVLFCDNADKAYSFLEKVCRKLKNVYILDDNYEKYDTLIKKVYENYGFYIYFTENMNNVRLSDRIYINLAENTDFINDENIMVLNLAKNNIYRDGFINTFSFVLSEEFKEFSKYFKYTDQECIEFLINLFYKNCSKADISRFKEKYNVRLKKICLKNYWQIEINLL